MELHEQEEWKVMGDLEASDRSVDAFYIFYIIVKEERRGRGCTNIQKCNYLSSIL